MIEYFIFWTTAEEYQGWMFWGIWNAENMREAINKSNVGTKNPSAVLVLDGRQKVLFERSGWSTV